MAEDIHAGSVCATAMPSTRSRLRLPVRGSAAPAHCRHRGRARQRGLRGHQHTDALNGDGHQFTMAFHLWRASGRETRSLIPVPSRAAPHERMWSCRPSAAAANRRASERGVTDGHHGDRSILEHIGRSACSRHRQALARRAQAIDWTRQSCLRDWLGRPAAPPPTYPACLACPACLTSPTRPACPPCPCLPCPPCLSFRLTRLPYLPSTHHLASRSPCTVGRA